MVNVIGLGYIGLPTALMMASHGISVVGTDYNKELVNTLNCGKVTFEEKGLKELYGEAVQSGIRFTSEYQVRLCWIAATFAIYRILIIYNLPNIYHYRILITFTLPNICHD